MELFAPSYYQEFTCIADRCRHSCCIGWEIDVDEDTLDAYEGLTSDIGKRILQSIDLDGCPHFRLSAGERCPHLDEGGLCRIILTLGEDYLCDICREHPRFYHLTPHGMEVGLGMACEEACRLILSHEAYWNFSKVGEVGGENSFADFDASLPRGRIYEILSDKSCPYPERLARLYATYGVTPGVCSDADWRRLLASLEYLDEEHRSLFGCYSLSVCVPCEHEVLLERALAYFIFRHCSDALDEDAFSASLGVAFFFERLLASMIAAREGCTVAETLTFARILSEELEYSEENTEAVRCRFSSENEARF